MNYFWFTKSSDSGLSPDKIISKASSYLGTNAFNPYRLNESWIKSSSTSTKNSWPSISQNQLTHPPKLSSSESSFWSIISRNYKDEYRFTKHFYFLYLYNFEFIQRIILFKKLNK